MISYFSKNEKDNLQFCESFKELKVARNLKAANITKASSPNNNQNLSALAIFSFLSSLVFQGMTLYRFLNSKYGKDNHSKNAYYRFLGNAHYNWEKFLLLLAGTLISKLHQLTCAKRVNVFIVDDSVVSKKRSKNMELMARLYDHVEHRYDKGFSLVTLGWSDGFSLVPVAFNLLSSAKKCNRYNDSKDFDKRSLAYRRRQKSIMTKTDATIELIEKALNQGIQADYVLMDTWFTHEPLIQRLLDLGLDTIGMVKQLKQTYIWQEKTFTLPQLRRQVKLDKHKEVAGEIYVTTKNGVPVKIVFLRNRNKKSEFLYLLTTDTSLTKEEVVRLYGNRWKIEVFFKTSKSFLKLGKEYQSPNYDNLVAHTTIVFTRYILLEWLRRKEQDDRTYGDLFFLMSQEVQDLPFEEALRQLLTLFSELLDQMTQKESILCQLKQWIDQQPLFIKSLAQEFNWES